MKAFRVYRAGAALALLGALCGACGLRAQDSDYGPYKFDIKTRLAMYTGEMRDINQQNNAFGFGLQVRRELFGPSSAVSFEVTWEHIPSMHNDIIDYAKHSGLNTDHSIGKLALSPVWSFDSRKEKARGFSALIGYYSKFPTDLLSEITGNLEWFAGLRIDRYQVYSEFKWQFRDQGTATSQPVFGTNNYGGTPRFYQAEPNPTANPQPDPSVPGTTGWLNGGKGSTGAFHEEGAAITPGAFAGIKYTYSEVMSVEFAARYFGRKHWDFLPITYFYKEGDFKPEEKTKGGTLTAGTTAGYGLELALVWKL